MNINESARPEPVRGPTLAAIIGAVVVAGIGLYLAIRVPAVRNAFLALTPHRASGDAEITRQLLAPRSVAVASVALIVFLGVVLFLPYGSTALARRYPRPMIGAVVAACFAALISVSAIVNLHAFHMRKFGGPVGTISQAQVLGYYLPQAWPDSRNLLTRVESGARIAFRTDSPDRFFLPSLCYPIQFYEVWPPEGDDAAARASSLGLTHQLLYRPFYRAAPLDLKTLP